MLRFLDWLRPLAVGGALAILGCGDAAADGVLCPNGAYVARGPCTLCPDGGYVGAGTLCAGAQVGTFAAPATRRTALSAPPARSSSIRTILCPDGSYVTGTRCVQTGTGRYTGE